MHFLLSPLSQQSGKSNPGLVVSPKQFGGFAMDLLFRDRFPVVAGQVKQSLSPGVLLTLEVEAGRPQPEFDPHGILDSDLEPAPCLARRKFTFGIFCTLRNVIPERAMESLLN